jgi:cathepsin C
VPDSDKTSYRAGWDGFESSSNLEMHLGEDYQVSKVGEDTASVGKWTMVYDEGFEIQFKSTKYFAFSKYQPDGGSHATSYCDKTLIGWYNNHQTNDRGCYYAEKSETVEASKSLDSVSVVQPKYMSDEDMSRLSMVQISMSTEKPQNVKEMSQEDHESIVADINNSGRLWKAKVYDHMVGKSFS